jgi:23S rRNA pseudouridine2605 synthase
MSDRIHKILANAGYGSRRGIEQLISAGRITINGKIAQLGSNISDQDNIAIDGQIVSLLTVLQQTRVIIYHKPTGEICTRHDPQQRKTVFQQLPVLAQGRWISVGRLDLNTQGLLMFTNNGQLVHKLTHPNSSIEREYAVRVHGVVNDVVLSKLKQGILLDDGLAKFSNIVLLGGKASNIWLRVTVTEGRNRLVRKLWATQACQVNRLIRIRFGVVTLPNTLLCGHWQELTATSCKQLLASAGLAGQ